MLLQGLQLTGLFQYGVRQAAEVETLFTSVERIVTYADMQPEGSLTSSVDRNLNAWPEHGAIEFRDLVVTYSPDLPPVLRGLNLL